MIEGATKPGREYEFFARKIAYGIKECGELENEMVQDIVKDL
jgi:hypothetical protein